MSKTDIIGLFNSVVSNNNQTKPTSAISNTSNVDQSESKPSVDRVQERTVPKYLQTNSRKPQPYGQKRKIIVPKHKKNPPSTTVTKKTNEVTSSSILSPAKDGTSMSQHQGKQFKSTRQTVQMVPSSSSSDGTKQINPSYSRKPLQKVTLTKQPQKTIQTEHQTLTTARKPVQTVTITKKTSKTNALSQTPLQSVTTTTETNKLSPDSELDDLPKYMEYSDSSVQSDNDDSESHFTLADSVESSPQKLHRYSDHNNYTEHVSLDTTFRTPSKSLRTPVQFEKKTRW